jgi:hypothetical protein
VLAITSVCYSCCQLVNCRRRVGSTARGRSQSSRTCLGSWAGKITCVSDDESPITDHLATYVRPEPEALIFPGPLGGPLRRGNFNRQSGWPRAVAAIGASGLHFHDLRHTGNAWAATSGAGLRDLMARMGHDSERAAIIYQHQPAEPTPRSQAQSMRTPRPSAAQRHRTPPANGTLMPRRPTVDSEATNLEGASR